MNGVEEGSHYIGGDQQSERETLSFPSIVSSSRTPTASRLVTKFMKMMTCRAVTNEAVNPRLQAEDANAGETNNLSKEKEEEEENEDEGEREGERQS